MLLDDSEVSREIDQCHSPQVALKKNSDALQADYKRQQEQHARDEAALQACHQREVLLVRHATHLLVPAERTAALTLPPLPAPPQVSWKLPDLGCINRFELLIRRRCETAERRVEQLEEEGSEVIAHVVRSRLKRAQVLEWSATTQA